MSMLAERKTKQKWSLNPRGKAWSDDSNKFGQKLLEKMGWSKGKGIGAKEDGIIEHIKVSYKNDSKGMGYRENDNQWTEHDSNFNAFLQSLSGEIPKENDIKVSSLEEKSQNSKVRVHYKKFTRGKDLSRYSEKDLANIFGKKSLKQTDDRKNEEDDIKEESSNEGFLYNGGSMVDYFKKKLPKYDEGVLKKKRKNSLEGEETYTGFGFKSEKRRKLNEDDGKDQGLSNPAFDPLFNHLNVQKHLLNTIEEECEENQEFEKQNKNEEIVHKSKKKKKKKTDFETSTPLKKDKELSNSVNNNDERKKAEEEISGVETMDSNKVKKKKKKENGAIVNPSSSESTTSLKNDNYEVKRKKSKSFEENISHYEVKRKTKHKNGIANPNFDESVGNDSYNNDFEIKRKKKKSDLAIDNPTFDDVNDSQKSYVDSNFEVKRKKKKVEIDNPNFENSEKTEEPTFDLILNVTSTPVVDSSTKRRKNVRFSEVNEERIIPNEDLENRNELFDINSRIIENGLKEDLDEMSKKIEGFQAEIENDMNEAKVVGKFVGEVGNPDGENEKLPNGTKLKFKYAKFGKSTFWNNKTTTAKTSYKHLIKGDIVLEFPNTNLHEIVGYGVNKTK